MITRASFQKMNLQHNCVGVTKGENIPDQFKHFLVSLLPVVHLPVSFQKDRIIIFPTINAMF